MKKLLLVFTIAAVISAGCAKKKITPIQPEVQTVYLDTNMHMLPIDTSIVISGLSDMNTTPWGQFTLPLSIIRTTGPQQLLTMTITGLPNNTRHEWSSESGYPSFNTDLHLDMQFVKAGSYPLKISGRMENGRSKNYDVTLLVDSMTQRECNAKFYAYINPTFKTIEPLIDSTIYENTNVYFHEGKLLTGDIVLVFDYDPNNYYRMVTATVEDFLTMNMDCENGILTILPQEVVGYSQGGAGLKNFIVSGSGKIDLKTNAITINYTTTFDNNGTPATRNYTLVGYSQ